MSTITTMEELKLAIRELEDQDYVNEQFMRRRVSQVAEDIKPINIAKNLFQQAIGRSARTNLLRTAAGMGTTWLIGKFFKKKA
ncbi:MAG TPA: hypothetical protein VK563_08830 [Puia sp.]|nr:hypothetical protein [Puia sp.]